MGFLFNSKKEMEEIRGIPDGHLPTLKDLPLIMVALARFMESEGCDDEVLIKELYRRGGLK